MKQKLPGWMIAKMRNAKRGTPPAQGKGKKWPGKIPDTSEGWEPIGECNADGTEWTVYRQQKSLNRTWDGIKIVARLGATQKANYATFYSHKENRFAKGHAIQILTEYRPTLHAEALEICRQAHLAQDHLKTDFAGRAGTIPSAENGWVKIRQCQDENQTTWAIYLKPNPPEQNEQHLVEETNWIKLKAVATESAKGKVNYWLSYNPTMKRLARSADPAEMQTNRPELYKKIMGICQELKT